MKKKTFSRPIAALSVASLLVFSACATSNAPVQNDSQPSGNTYESGYMDGFKKAREMAYMAGVPEVDVRTALNGTVASVNGNSLTIDIMGLIVDEQVDGVGLRRTINTSEAEIIQLEELDPAEFERLNTQFIAQLNAASDNANPPVPPSPYTEVSITAGEISEGARITVHSGEGEDLTLMSQITPTKITVSPRPPVAPAVMEEDTMMEDPSMMMEEEGTVQ